MRFYAFLAILCLALGMNQPAHASCSDLVIDELGMPDIGKVTDAARRLNQAGYEVRVRTFKSRRSAKDIDDFEQKYRTECPEWLSNGKLRSSMLLYMYVDNRTHNPWVAAYYGNGLARLDGSWRKIVSERFLPRIESYRGGEKAALIPGFVQVLDEFREELNRSSTTSSYTKKEAVDLSGLWRVLGFLVFVIAAGFAIVVVLRLRGSQGDVQAAQSRARTMRASARDRIMALNEGSNFVVLKAKIGTDPQLLAKVLRAEGLGQQGLKALRRFDDPSRDDPNKQALSTEVYTQNEQRYADILVQYVEPAEALIAEVEASLQPPASTGSVARASA